MKPGCFAAAMYLWLRLASPVLTWDKSWVLQPVPSPFAEEKELSEQGRGLQHFQGAGDRVGQGHLQGLRGPGDSSTHPGGVGLVELVEHDNGGAAVVIHQPPEVGGGVLQRVQGDDEGSALGVALRRGKTSAIKDMAAALKPLLSTPQKNSVTRR